MESDGLRQMTPNDFTGSMSSYRLVSELGELEMFCSDPIDSLGDASDLGELGMSGSDPTDSLGGDLTEGVPLRSPGSVEVLKGRLPVQSPMVGTPSL